MRKYFIIIMLSIICIKTFAFEHFGSRIVHLEPVSIYGIAIFEFFYVDITSPVDVLSLGMFMIGGRFFTTYNFASATPVRIIENDIDLQQSVKDMMRQLGANVSMWPNYADGIRIHILFPNGRYTTLVYQRR